MTGPLSFGSPKSDVTRYILEQELVVVTSAGSHCRQETSDLAAPYFDVSGHHMSTLKCWPPTRSGGAEFKTFFSDKEEPTAALDAGVR